MEEDLRLTIVEDPHAVVEGMLRQLLLDVFHGSLHDWGVGQGNITA